ncbi:MAG: hypothetical protein JWR76_611, partial [Mucilaginibacter sp.]|nr:hypothetical protein [Mucilaginibacter sp.]
MFVAIIGIILLVIGTMVKRSPEPGSRFGG